MEGIDGVVGIGGGFQIHSEQIVSSIPRSISYLMDATFHASTF